MLKKTKLRKTEHGFKLLKQA